MNKLVRTQTRSCSLRRSRCHRLGLLIDFKQKSCSSRLPFRIKPLPVRPLPAALELSSTIVFLQMNILSQSVDSSGESGADPSSAATLWRSCRWRSSMAGLCRNRSASSLTDCQLFGEGNSADP